MEVSPSSLNVFLKCPLQWYFMKSNYPQIYIDDTAAKIGSFVHHVIYSYFVSLDGEVKNEQEIELKVKNIYNSCFDSRFNVFRNEIDAMIRNFIAFERYRLKFWERYIPELVEFRVTIKDYLTGIVDFYGNKTIIDWKTGKYPFMTLDLKRQGNLYRYMLEELGYRVDKILFVYIRNNKTLEIPYDRNWIEREVNKMIQQIEAGIFQPNEGDHCRFCRYVMICQFMKRGVCSWMI